MSHLPRKKSFSLPLLASFMGSALLTACHQEADTRGMTRNSFRTLAECQAAYAQQIRQGLQNPCTQSGGQTYGPYYSSGSGGIHFLGYTRSGSVSTDGLSLNAGHASSYHAGTVSRGGFGGHSSGHGGS